MKKQTYRNVFAELGHTDEQIKKRLDEIVHELFYSEDRVYFTAGDDMGYLEDTGNHDARTEGMSYGMMMCVQLDKKEEFDRIWKWSKTYMYMTEGFNEGYFAWSCKTNGEKNAWGPAPDGEEFYAMALFFASHRWGDGEGIFNYSEEARKILHACITKGSNGREGAPMWNRDNKQILFCICSLATLPFEDVCKEIAESNNISFPNRYIFRFYGTAIASKPIHSVVYAYMHTIAGEEDIFQAFIY